VTNSSNATVANGNSGSASFVVKYNAETFYLLNGSSQLAQATVSSSCASGSVWNESICELVQAFNYSLANSGNSSVTKTSGNAFTQNTISKTLSAGNTEAVSLSLSGVPFGVSYAISPNACSPTCSSTITFTVGPTAPVGTRTITVTGSPLSKQTSFNLIISGNPSIVSCSVTPTTIRIGESVTWTGTITGGTPPFTYRWSGTNIPTNPAPSANPYSRSYNTIGQKTAVMTVTDADNLQSSCPISGAGSASVQVNFDPSFEEF